MIKGAEKIQKRILKYEKVIESLSKEYAENPKIAQQLNDMQLIKSTLEFCLNCLESEAK